MLKSHQRGDLTPAETKVDYLRFAKVLYEERNGFKQFGAATGGTFPGVVNRKFGNRTQSKPIARLGSIGFGNRT